MAMFNAQRVNISIFFGLGKRSDLETPGLCMWVRAMETYDRVAKVEQTQGPKRVMKLKYLG
jgi:hypothetical protein